MINKMSLMIFIGIILSLGAIFSQEETSTVTGEVVKVDKDENFIILQITVEKGVINQMTFEVTGKTSITINGEKKTLANIKKGDKARIDYQLLLLEEKVKRIIIDQLGIDESEITPEASFIDDLGADSLDTVELVMAYEDAFRIDIPDEDAEKFFRVKDAIDYLKSRVKELEAIAIDISR